MEDPNRIYLEKVIDLIGDETGGKYYWFLIEFEAQGVINQHLTIEDIREKVDYSPGYYEVSWDFIKDISKKLSAVVYFHLIGTKSKEDFLNEVEKINQNEKKWSEIACELDFWIGDGEIWEINGSDIFLVNRLRKTFSQLPRLLW
ncbi:MAG: hypothetical protein AB7I18_04805 [Candidatus Berkiella sp.]